ncbi:CocE/NonD family hydrolase [Mesorhizobium sp. M7A.F.Ca.US.006.04.2.1]|uniref:CocE/NonD family hydrolase n=1 Tax=unclassified Mesorhizobium TaxID=325217 RepID=UPI000FCC6FAE|nr:MULTISPECIES: CocE/NonD family hydrolase [unclassified Mesorhizobium]RUX78070.1 CocE/NonD family hydrolase [Mesorhizobium sp. M7A.F.Ca.US.005.03.1.1]RUY17734.1 CocE/NonD family hydrolase [Mesorhizobium sp. M7A.F.Ca.US.005.03.2.1]RUY27287.1 CocE/NonD family hydrolase [Mesorhizobium sp. M7A.F.Ca.US.001.04.2.1]RUY42686.1 CocE/NonD family hydrolase [Mesorhizobium sp. M7A.F.Ca.US.001.04.1.1]RVA03508.1 CocE/NonD family hydrolase [Mesorhizobium sp. M7A.F.Ca.US.001.02.1.1]
MQDIRVVTDFPRKIREIENLWIPMPDGVKLAARVWLPEDAESDPVPAILEYLPYRKRDGTVERDALTHPYFAGHGYAGVRVDMRGSGDSEGLCKGEYLKQEQDDCLVVIEWLARQSWCSGSVGMIGISWGGFNGLQVAARRPPALKAVVSLCSTDDRYNDDVHYLGGAMMCDNLMWGTTAWAIAMTPPDPLIVGDRWRGLWKQRLNGNGIWMQDWFEHQRRDDFYKHGSICEDYSDVEIPVYAVGGWADGYPNPIFRMLEKLSGPRKGLIGPWGHKYPHFAMPGPRIGFLQECLRWWDQYLKGINTGIADEPMLRAWIQDPARPAAIYDERPGRWVAEPAWPGPGIGEKVLNLAPHVLSEARGEDTILEISSPQTAGLSSGAWCGYGVMPTLPVDQRTEEGNALIFETAPLTEAVEILGFPEFEVKLSSDKPVALLSATLSQVFPEGAASRVSYGILNLSHRNDDLDIAPMVPGRAETVRIKLRCCGQRFEVGERIRLALATSHWPIVFPTAEQATLSIHCGDSRLILPVRAPQKLDDTLGAFLAPESAAPMEQEVLTKGDGFQRSVSTDQVTGETVYQVVNDGGTVRHPHTGIVLSAKHVDRFSIHPDDPTSAVGTCTWEKSYGRGDWQARLSVTATVRALRDVWRIETHITAHDGDERIVDRSEVKEYRRDLN